MDWFDPAAPVDSFKTCVSGATTFEYETVTIDGAAGLFAERPFGEAGTPADAVAMRADAGGTVKPVVTAVVRGDGVGGAGRPASRTPTKAGRTWAGGTGAWSASRRRG